MYDTLEQSNEVWKTQLISTIVDSASLKNVGTSERHN